MARSARPSYMSPEWICVFMREISFWRPCWMSICPGRQHSFLGLVPSLSLLTSCSASPSRLLFVQMVKKKQKFDQIEKGTPKLKTKTNKRPHGYQANKASLPPSKTSSPHGSASWDIDWRITLIGSTCMQIKAWLSIYTRLLLSPGDWVWKWIMVVCLYMS